jgi:hypothetical protein
MHLIIKEKQMDNTTLFYTVLGLIFISGGMGYYIGERGWTGVQNDLNNVKLDIAHIQGKLGATQTTQIVTPVGSTKATDPIKVTTTSSK